MKQDMIVILDLGSTENTVVAREIRDMGVYSEIHPHDITPEELNGLDNVKGIILNGGENRVVDGAAVDVSPALYDLGYPVMAIDHPTAKCAQKLDALPDEATLKKFVFDECKAEPNWNMKNFIADQVELVKRQVGDRKVLLALSGGVDSSVVAALLLKAIGQQLVCVHVNHGLMRKNESESVVEVFQNQLHANLIYVDATERFLGKLEGVKDPEEKRKIIGGEFIRVFEEEARKLDGIDFLGQGTIYPDIIESGTKTAKMVKSHHNVGGLPEDLQFELVEPLKQLFKDEVRACGIELGLPPHMVYRQPFPGPGLGVRCLGAITRDRLEAVRESDAILREEFEKAGLDKKVWQYFTVVPDFKSVGMKNHARCFEYMVIIRAINTIDAMTASIEKVDWDVLEKITNRILAEVENVNRVCYDMSPKPPATIEVEYRGKLLSRGKGEYILVLNKALQKAVGFNGEQMQVEITMDLEREGEKKSGDKIETLGSSMDVITAIKSRKSIRKFTAKAIDDKMLNTLLTAGLQAPSAKNKRPCHIVVVKDKTMLAALASYNPNARMLADAACAMIVCGDRNAEGMKEFLYADCAAVSQNILLCAHGLGLGAVWCGVVMNSDWKKRIAKELKFPVKVEPISVIALGYPNESKEEEDRWDAGKIHFDRW